MNTQKKINDKNLLLVPLWASAFVLAALVIWQAGQANLGKTARAEMAAVGSEYSMLTTDSGNGEFLTILNNRDGDMFVYEVTTSHGATLVDRIPMISFVQPPGNRPNN